MHVHAHVGTRVHEATSLTGLVPERIQLTVHTTEPTGTVPEPFHCDHIARWSARSGASGRSGTGLNTGNWNGSGTVLVSNLWCEHGLRYTHARTRSHKQNTNPKYQTHTRISAHIHAHTRARAHMHARTRAHTRTHAHAHNLSIISGINRYITHKHFNYAY